MTIAFAPPRAAAPALPHVGAGAWSALALTLAAFLIRLPHFGDPAFMIDEQFYLLAGDRMLHGALPYVDLWDRKPIGLFLLYAGIRLIGGAGVWQYQIVATLFAAATAFVVSRIARRPAGEGAATVAGLLYLLWIELAEGGGGQSPIFYNLPVAAAAWCVLAAIGRRDAHAFARLSFAAMALVGVALQIKYTVLVEGACFGLILSGCTLARLQFAPACRRIALLAATALAPTIAAFLCYVAIGEGRTFWFANFVSIFLRDPPPAGEMHYRIGMMALRIAPFALCIAASLVHLRRDCTAATARWRLVMLMWSASAIAGMFTVGTLYSHYILPLFAPLAAASAPIFARRTSGPVLAIFAAALPALTLQWPDFARTARHRQEMAALVALIPPRVDRECMEMFDGPPALYRLTNACTVTRFAFPDHLSAANEARAIGVDPAIELARALARRPLAITIADEDVRPPNERTFAMMRAALAHDYRLAGRAPHDGRPIDVWIRR